MTHVLYGYKFSWSNIFMIFVLREIEVSSISFQAYTTRKVLYLIHKITKIQDLIFGAIQY